MIHYVYVTRDRNGNFYIGVRTFDGYPPDDHKYFGSGMWIRDAIYNPQNYTKKFLQFFATREEAEIYELAEIKRCIGNPRCMNMRVQRYNLKARLGKACT